MTCLSVSAVSATKGGERRNRRALSGQVMRAAKKAGHTGTGFGKQGRGTGSRFGRGRSAALAFASLAVAPGGDEGARSDLTLEQQISAPGATWLDRQLLVREPAVTGSGGFGIEVRDAMAEHLTDEGLAGRQGQRVLFARNLLDTLRRRELNETIGKIAAETGLIHRPSGRARRRDLPAAGDLELTPVCDDR
jgi:hypothetical protein